jgi:dUTP pyrophosphatase
MTISIKCKKLLDSASVPTRAHEHDAGWDLYSSERSFVISSKRKVVSTSISLAIPDGYVGLIWPRSGLAAKKGIDVFAGVIDSGYRGEIKVCLYNSSGVNFEINKGDRIAQIIFHKIPQTEMLEVDSLGDSIRGDSGFGSSGV